MSQTFQHTLGKQLLTMASSICPALSKSWRAFPKSPRLLSRLLPSCDSETLRDGPGLPLPSCGFSTRCVTREDSGHSWSARQIPSPSPSPRDYFPRSRTAGSPPMVSARWRWAAHSHAQLLAWRGACREARCGFGAAGRGSGEVEGLRRGERRLHGRGPHLATFGLQRGRALGGGSLGVGARRRAGGVAPPAWLS